MDARSFETGFYIPKLTLLEIFPLAPFLYGRERMSCLEVGGNIGLWCEAFFNVFGKNIKQFDTFEPMPGNAALFRHRIENYLTEHRSKIKFNQSGVGDTNGVLDLHFSTEVSTVASAVVKEMTFGANLMRNDKTMSVPVVTLDNYLQTSDIDVVDLIKIDVEGFEWNVIHGMMNAIKSDKMPNIYFEFGMHQEHIGQSFKQFFELFNDNGYKIYRQEVGRNYFGLNLISRYSPQFEDRKSMWMILASKNGPNPMYKGPRVVGQIN